MRLSFVKCSRIPQEGFESVGTVHGQELFVKRKGTSKFFSIPRQERQDDLIAALPWKLVRTGESRIERTKNKQGQWEKYPVDIYVEEEKVSD